MATQFKTAIQYFMPRLFSAIALPDWAIDQLSNLRGGLPFARWIEPQDYHITLAFFGDVDPPVADEIVSELDRIYAAPCTIEITGVGSFSRKSKPYNLHANVRLTQSLVDLHRDHTRILRRLGFPPDRHTYHPHITLARLGAGDQRGKRSSFAHVADEAERSQHCADWLRDRTSFQLSRFSVHAFALYSAIEGVGGGPYLEEEVFQLKMRG